MDMHDLDMSQSFQRLVIAFERIALALEDRNEIEALANKLEKK